LLVLCLLQISPLTVGSCVIPPSPSTSKISLDWILITFQNFKAVRIYCLWFQQNFLSSTCCMMATCNSNKREPLLGKCLYFTETVLCSHLRATYPCSGSHESIPNFHTRKTRCNITIQSMLFSCKLPLSFRTSNEQSKRISLLSHACHMPHPPHPPLLNHSNIQREVGDKNIKHLIMQFCPASSYFLPFESSTSFSISYLLTETLRRRK
jgi:hypothetical protein